MDKTCKKCHKTKPIEMFRKLKANTDGHTGSCKECLNTISRKLAARPDQIAKKAARNKIWKEQHRDEWRIAHAKSQRIRTAKRYTKDVITNAIRTKVWRQLTTGKYGKHTFDLLGYSVEDLMKHLASQFRDGMSWDNYGEWHIDHIIPKSVFNVTAYDDIDFKRCWSLDNLQPLWAAENYIKRDKLIKPFQPSLNIRVAS